MLTIELLVVTMEMSTDWLDKFSRVLVITWDSSVNCNYGNNDIIQQ